MQSLNVGRQVRAAERWIPPTFRGIGRHFRSCAFSCARERGTPEDSARNSEFARESAKATEPDLDRRPAVYKDSQPAVFLSYSLRATRFFMREGQRHTSCLPMIPCGAHGAMHIGGTLWGTFRRGQSPTPQRRAHLFRKRPGPPGPLKRKSFQDRTGKPKRWAGVSRPGSQRTSGATSGKRRWNSSNPARSRLV